MYTIIYWMYVAVSETTLVFYLKIFMQHILYSLYRDMGRIFLPYLSSDFNNILRPPEIFYDRKPKIIILEHSSC